MMKFSRCPLFIDVRRITLRAFDRTARERWPRVPTMYMVSARGVSGVASSASQSAPRYSTRAVPSGFQVRTRTVCPTSSEGCGGGVARASRQRCATIVSTTPQDARHRELHRLAGAEQCGDAAKRRGDADRQQIERAGEELGANQNRRRDPPDPMTVHRPVLPRVTARRARIKQFRALARPPRGRLSRRVGDAVVRMSRPARIGYNYFF